MKHKIAELLRLRKINNNIWQDKFVRFNEEEIQKQKNDQKSFNLTLCSYYTTPKYARTERTCEIRTQTAIMS